MESFKQAVVKFLAILAVVADAVTIMSVTRDINIGTFSFVGVLNIFLFVLLAEVMLELRRIRKLGNISVDGIDLTVISQLNYVRKKNKGFKITCVEYRYEFFDNGFEAFIRYGGEVTKILGAVKGVTLNFSGDSNQTAASIDAYAYDNISNDGSRIMAAPLSPGGLNKQFFFAFQHPLKRNEKFDYTFHYKWLNCVNPDKDYIAAVPAFDIIDPNVLNLEVVFNDMKVQDFKIYSINNYKPSYEARIEPKTKENSQIFKYQYTLGKKNNLVLAVFYF